MGGGGRPDLPARLNRASESIIGAAIEVHRELGPGLLEGIYADALVLELEDRGHVAEQEVPVRSTYKGRDLGQRLRLDLLMDDEIVLEVKAVETVQPVHRAQLLSYLRQTSHRLGLLLNFHVPRLVDGIHRVVH